MTSQAVCKCSCPKLSPKWRTFFLFSKFLSFFWKDVECVGARGKGATNAAQKEKQANDWLMLYALGMIVFVNVCFVIGYTFMHQVDTANATKRVVREVHIREVNHRTRYLSIYRYTRYLSIYLYTAYTVYTYYVCGNIHRLSVPLCLSVSVSVSVSVSFS
jgi:hypothetical protein